MADDINNISNSTTTTSVNTTTCATEVSQQIKKNHQENGKFICGVVEGFYGRPWTTEQRKDLFLKLKKWGMDSYVYAPKDDYKHRAYWRELYTVEEGDHLTGLITAAKEQNITFYYALSPGLDMTYSSSKEVQALKRKLEQVSQFGCEAFALLFDDIEPEMSKADKEVFQTFAHAQVTVTNEIYNHLNCASFLFCPTQYCSTRAVPTVSNSEYLLTLGTKLSQDIDILWTGPRVISKLLTMEMIQEITEVLRRPPVMWDNLHANDYDQKRVFLGPYSGRSPEHIPLLRGVLTNPNCEFHANAIAIHTLAHWSKCSSDTKINNSVSADIRLETENEDGVYGEEAPISLSRNVYHPRVALKNAINDWLPEFFLSKEAYGPISKPHPALTMVMPVLPILPSVNTCMSLTTTTTTTSSTAPIKVAEVNTTQLQALADVCSVVTGTDPLTLPTVVMNSLVSSTKIVTNETVPNSSSVTSPISNISLPTIPVPVSSIGIPISNIAGTDYKLPNAQEDDDAKKMDELMPAVDDVESKVDDKVDVSKLNNGDDVMACSEFDQSPIEPMECVSSMTSPKHTLKCSDDVIMSENVSTSSTGSMQIEGVSDTSVQSTEMTDEPIPSDKFTHDKQSITADDLSLLCDLFYLPFEHGNRALQLLNEFNWLKSNATVLVHSDVPQHKGRSSMEEKPEIQEWCQRAERFHRLNESVVLLAKKLARCENRELCYELFSYIWDIAGVVTLLSGFVKWLSLGYFPSTINSYTQGSYTWFSKGWRETFMSGDQEPWVFRGGLTADLQRLIPVDSGNDLFIYKLPDVPSTSFPIIRPYTHLDENQVYGVCRRSCLDGSDCSVMYPESLQSIAADRLVGPFVTINPELVLVVEENNDIIGCACGALDAKLFHRNMEMCWYPAMCTKYPISLLEAPHSETLTQTAIDNINHFHNFHEDFPETVLSSHPSVLSCFILTEQLKHDQSLAKRLVTVLLAALRSNGSSGVHVCIQQNEPYLQQFYAKLGFVELYQIPNGKIYLGRNF